MHNKRSGWRDRQGFTRAERENAERLAALNEKLEPVFGRGDSLLRPALAGLAIGASLFLVLTNWNGIASAGTKTLSALSNPVQQVRPASGLSYRNCKAARAAGAAPVYAGQPGYGPHLDADGDGIGCEPYYR